jgi:CubicO group peptidase (beta-lactamase class C family)
MDRATLVAALDSVARAHVASDNVAGMSVAVVQGSDTLLMRGYGHVDLEWEVVTPEDGSATYEIGSITKQFTAAAIMQLVEEGKLDLDTDFTEYLPAFDAAGHTVPLRRLLDHTSGIKSYTAVRGLMETLFGRDVPPDTMVSLVEAIPFEFEPGTAQIYNNSAYFLLGLIIRDVSGMSYEDYVETNFFEKLGMDSSHYCSEREIHPGTAHGYSPGPDGLLHKEFMDHQWPYAAGSLCSSVGDLIRWNSALHGGEILSPDGYAAMTSPMPLTDGTDLDYAMGLGVAEQRGTLAISHGGGINGFVSYGIHYPERDVTIVALQNSNGPPPAAVVAGMADFVVGPSIPLEERDFDGDLDALVGEYAGPVRGSHFHFVVQRDGDDLLVGARGADEPEVATYLEDGTWRAGGNRFRFKVMDGRATEVMLLGGSARYRLRWVP